MTEKILPEGWEWKNLMDLCNVTTGKKDANFATEDGLYSFFTCAYLPLKSPSYSFEGPSLLLPGNGVNVGEVFFYDEKFEAYQRTYVINGINVSPKFLYYAFKYKWAKHVQNDQFGTATNYIKIGNFQKFNIPIPPLPEQQRIAARLDALMGQLEKAKSALAAFPDIIKSFRQAVLAQAVSGRLTEDWRGEEMNWRIENASQCCDKVQSGGTPKENGFTDEGIPFLKVYNIVNDRIDFEYRPQFITELAHRTSGKKSNGLPNDVIMNIVGPPLNKIAILPNTFPEWNLNQAITLFRPKEYLLSRYLYYFFKSGISVRSVIGETRGVVGQVNISLSQCREFEISLPPLPEQHEIVRRVERLFAYADSLEQQYVQLKEKLELIPQAILAKAFRGEL